MRTLSQAPRYPAGALLPRSLLACPIAGGKAYENACRLREPRLLQASDGGGCRRHDPLPYHRSGLWLPRQGRDRATAEGDGARLAGPPSLHPVCKASSVVVTPANEQERKQVEELCRQVQAVTGDSVELTWVDRGYTEDDAQAAAAEHGIRLEVVRLPGAKKGFVLLPRRWVVERSFAWKSRFRFGVAYLTLHPKASRSI